MAAETGYELHPLLDSLLEKTVGDCGRGVISTSSNGVLLTIDPPDPAWRRVALPERMPRPSLATCRLSKGCPAIVAAQRALIERQVRVAELQEALAVASNRFGNAVSAKDNAAQVLHMITMQATSGELAEADAHRSTAGKALVVALKRAGLRSAVIPRARVALALKAGAAGKGIPAAAVTRLLRKKLIVSRADAVAAVRADARASRPAAYDVLAALTAAPRTSQMNAAARSLTLADLVLLVRALHRDLRTPTAVRQRQELQLEGALRCDAQSGTALRSIAADVSSAGGLRGEPGALIAWTASITRVERSSERTVCPA